MGLKTTNLKLIKTSNQFYCIWLQAIVSMTLTNSKSFLPPKNSWVHLGKTFHRKNCLWISNRLPFWNQARRLKKSRPTKASALERNLQIWAPIVGVKMDPIKNKGPSKAPAQNLNASSLQMARCQRSMKEAHVQVTLPGENKVSGSKRNWIRQCLRKWKSARREKWLK